MTQFRSVVTRFGKAFIYGGLASVLAQLAIVPTLATLEDLKTWGTALLFAFLTGGIMALEKALNWQPKQ